MSIGHPRLAGLKENGGLVCPKIKMIPEEDLFHKEHLEKCLREVEKLRELGITEYAIVTYLIRVREGRSKERALNGLLEGRDSLTKEQKRLVRTILEGLPITDATWPG